MKTVLKEKVKSAPKELLRRGLDDGAERLRTQMRDAAQGGQRDEYGGDRLEDAAAGAAHSGKNRALRQLERVRQKRRKTRTDARKHPETETPQDAQDGPEAPGDAAPVDGESVPQLDPRQGQGAPYREDASMGGPTQPMDKQGAATQPPAIKTREAMLRQQTGGASGQQPQREAVRHGEAHAVEQGRLAARAGAEKKRLISAELVSPSTEAARQARSHSIADAVMPKAEGRNTPLGQPLQAVRDTPSGAAIRANRRDTRASRHSGISRPPEGMGRRADRKQEKMVRSGVKTANRTAGTLPKGTRPVHPTGRGYMGAARQTARAVQPVQKKAAATSAKAAARTAVSTTKAAIAAGRSLLTALLAGGWVALVIVIFLCLIGLLVSSPFGIFFSGEDANSDGRTMRVVMREINAEFSQRLSEIEAANPHDELDVGGTAVNWKDVLAIYTVKYSTGSEVPMELVTITPEKEAYLREVFWDMNVITSEVEEVTSTTETGTAAVRVLHIRITGRSQAEIAEEYGFNSAQMEQLASLTGSQLDAAWRYLLYGTSGGSTDIVAVALSQVTPANDGGDVFWSWYGFSAREEWCACFVSWCANECGYVEVGTIPKFASCTAGMGWFEVRGQWMDNTYVPQPGDLIFFDWDLSGDAEHVGIVERVEGGLVYTVEGNSGDAVRQNLYSLDNPQIRGYGAPTYS